MSLNPQAEALNQTLSAVNPHVLEMLSARGKAVYFPKRGILAQSAAAAGKAINATIGTALEDDGRPMAIEALLSQFTSGNRAMFNYAPAFGKPEIRKYWAESMLRKNPGLAGLPVSHPVATAALTHGLSMAGYLFVDEGDTIILPDLYWENYDLVFCNAYGARIATFDTFAGDGFNTEAFRKALAAAPAGKKIVLLNFPNNPTGYTVTRAEAEALRDALVAEAEAGNNLVVLVDDAYFGLLYEKGYFTESIFSLLAGAHERILAVKLDGPTKEDYVWGFRVGFMTFGCAKHSPDLFAVLEAKLGGAIRGSISNVSNLAQTTLLAAYLDPAYEEERKGRAAVLRRRYELLRDLLAAHPEYGEYFESLPFNSGYFMCLRFKSGDAERVQQILLEDFDCGVIAFGAVMRLAFSSTPYDKIETMLDSIYRAAKQAAG
jgi:aspartate/methionine/tyrosine aminotransferase